MRTLLIILLTASSVFAQKDVETVQIKTSAVCEMCKETIEKEMAFSKGVTKVELNVETAMLTVSFKSSKTNVETIRKAINKVGYDADDSPAEPQAYENLHHCCKKGSH